MRRESERLRGELERSEHRRRELVESVPAFVLALDEKGRITTWNRRLEQTTGYVRSEMLGSDGTALVGSDEGPRALPLKSGETREANLLHDRAPAHRLTAGDPIGDRRGSSGRDHSSSRNGLRADFGALSYSCSLY